MPCLLKLPAMFSAVNSENNRVTTVLTSAKLPYSAHQLPKWIQMALNVCDDVHTNTQWIRPKEQDVPSKLDQSACS